MPSVRVSRASTRTGRAPPSLLDEPFEIPPNCALMVTVLSASEGAAGDWLAAAQRTLARAYDDEPEYTAADLKR